MGVRSTSCITREDACKILKDFANSEKIECVSNERIGKMLEAIYDYDNFCFVEKYDEDNKCKKADQNGNSCPKFRPDLTFLNLEDWPKH